MPLVPSSVRGRLWTALGLLALAIVCISTLTWIALQRVDARLQDLHRQSLAQVAQAIDLSKRSSDLATSAPYLLNQQSNFLIEQEGEKLLGILERVREEWPTSATAETDRAALTALTVEMENGIRDLVVAVRADCETDSSRERCPNQGDTNSDAVQLSGVVAVPVTSQPEYWLDRL